MHYSAVIARSDRPLPVRIVYIEVGRREGALPAMPPAGTDTGGGAGKQAGGQSDLHDAGSQSKRSRKRKRKREQALLNKANGCVACLVTARTRAIVCERNGMR